MLDIVFRNFTSDRKYGKNFFKKILEKAIGKIGLKTKKIELGLLLIGNKRIKKLNKKYRNKNKATDVLSFPLRDDSLKKYGIMPIGDIFISLPFAKTEANKFGVSLDDELRKLAVHGFLHLLGYDHEKSDKEGRKMLALQEKILEF